MSHDDWLIKLAAEHAPAALGWWPLAPGWWALLALALASLAALYGWRRPSLRRRRIARAELRRLRGCELEPAPAARAIQSLLRRYALAVFGRDAIARLNGDAWLKFLIDAGGQGFVGHPGRALLAAAYGGANSAVSQADRHGWFDAADQFLRRARPPRGPRA